MPTHASSVTLNNENRQLLLQHLEMPIITTDEVEAKIIDEVVSYCCIYQSSLVLTPPFFPNTILNIPPLHRGSGVSWLPFILGDQWYEVTEYCRQGAVRIPYAVIYSSISGKEDPFQKSIFVLGQIGGPPGFLTNRDKGLDSP